MHNSTTFSGEKVTNENLWLCKCIVWHGRVLWNTWNSRSLKHEKSELKKPNFLIIIKNDENKEGQFMLSYPHILSASLTHILINSLRVFRFVFFFCRNCARETVFQFSFKHNFLRHERKGERERIKLKICFNRHI